MVAEDLSSAATQVQIVRMCTAERCQKVAGSRAERRLPVSDAPTPPGARARARPHPGGAPERRAGWTASIPTFVTPRHDIVPHVWTTSHGCNEFRHPCRGAPRASRAGVFLEGCGATGRIRCARLPAHVWHRSAVRILPGAALPTYRRGGAKSSRLRHLKPNRDRRRGTRAAYAGMMAAAEVFSHWERYA